MKDVYIPYFMFWFKYFEIPTGGFCDKISQDIGYSSTFFFTAFYVFLSNLSLL